MRGTPGEWNGTRKKYTRCISSASPLVLTVSGVQVGGPGGGGGNSGNEGSRAAPANRPAPPSPLDP